MKAVHQFMVSCNVQWLFTNDPIEAAVQTVLQKLEGDPSLVDHTTLTCSQIADLLNFVSSSTYFQYNGSIYQQLAQLPSFLQKITKTKKLSSRAEPIIAYKSTAVLPYVKGLSDQTSLLPTATRHAHCWRLH